MTKVTVNCVPENAPTFQTGELVLFREHGTIFLVTAARRDEQGKVVKFDGVAIRHNNYHFGRLVANVEIHAYSKWERFQGSIELTQ